MPDKKPELADGFIQFSRIGRWGTCVACPRDTDGHVYPEFCRYTDRYDHNLTVDELAASHKIYDGKATPSNPAPSSSKVM
jgi:hypothetical protein